MTIKASVTTSMVSRTAIVRAHKLIQLLPENNRRLLEGATRLLKAASFSSDVTLDASTFASRAMASSAVARRGIWLRAWPADLRVKNIVVAYPFQSEKLFGNALNRILIETKDKKKTIPKTIRHPDRRDFNHQSFQGSGTSSRARYDPKRPQWGFSRPTFQGTSTTPSSLAQHQAATTKLTERLNPGKHDLILLPVGGRLLNFQATWAELHVDA